MKKKLLVKFLVSLVFTLFCSNIYGQGIEIPNTFVSPPSCTYSLGFNGTSNFIPMENGIVPTGNTTIVAWVKPESVDGETILHWGPISGCSPSSQSFRIIGGKLNLSTGCGTAIEGNTTLTAGNWYHVAITISSAGVSTLYLNGVDDGSGNGRTGGGATVTTGVSTIGVGYNGGNQFNYFEGEMTEFSVWSKVLSSTEISDLMSGSINPNDVNIIRYYPFNEGQGSVVSNQSTTPQFNGVNSYVTIPNVVPANSFSVFLEVVPGTASANGTLFYQGPRNGCNPSGQALSIENGKIRASTGCGGNSDIFSTTTLSIGVTYNVGYTMSSTGVASLYINGVMEASGNTRNGNSVSTGNAEIGRSFNANSPTNYYQGKIGEVSIWNKEFTVTEVSNLETNGVNGTENNLLALYELSGIENGNIDDLSPNLNNATAINLSSATIPDLTVKGSQDNFSGNTYLTPSNGLSSNVNFSLIFRFTPGDVTAGSFYSYGPKSGCNPSQQSLTLNNGRVRFSTGCGGSAFIQSSSTLVVGQEYQIALLMNSTGIASLYIDGVFQASGNTTNGNSIGLGNDIIGARYSSNSLIGFLNGTLSEVSIWNTTLSGSGVLSIMNNGISGNEQSLQTWYTFDGTGNNTSVLDNTSNGNNGTITNPVVIGDPEWAVVNPITIDANVTVSGNEISADNLSADSYQWLDCNNGNTPILNDTNTSFTATQSGDYAVEVSQGACADTSFCEMIVITSLENLLEKEAKQLVIYPNPATSIINTEEGKLEIIDLTGNLVLSTESTGQVDVSSLDTGIYFVTQNGKNTKLVIE